MKTIKNKIFIAVFLIAFAFVALGIGIIKANSQSSIKTDYALALTEYKVDADLVKITSPNGDVVTPENGKFLLKVEGEYKVEYPDRVLSVTALRDNPAVEFKFDYTLSDSYSVGETVKIPKAEISSVLGKYDKYTVTVFYGETQQLSLNSAVLNNKSFVVKGMGEYKIVYSCSDDYTLNYTAEKTLTFNAVGDTFLMFNDLPAQVNYGNSISLGAIYATSGGKTYFAETKVTSPSGKIETVEDIFYTPQESGEYTFTAKADIDGQIVEKTQKVTVVYSSESYLANMFSIEKVEPCVALPSYSQKSGKGMYVETQTNKGSFYLSKLIDLTKFDKNTPLIEFIPYSDADSWAQNDIKVSLIDAYNPANTLTCYWWYRSNVSRQTYLSTFVKGVEYGGISNEGSSRGTVRKDKGYSPAAYGTIAWGSFFNCYNMTDKSNPFNISYDAGENALYIVTTEGLTLVMDYDNADYVSYSDFWSGFSHNLAYLKVEFMQKEAVTALYIKSICGEEITSEVLTDPKDETCFVLETSNIPNQTVVGYAYDIPSYKVNTMCGNTQVSVKVLKNGTEINGAISNGKFTATETGDYVIRYSGKDCYGNLIEKDFTVTALATPNAFVFPNTVSNNANLLEFYEIPEISVGGGIGKVRIEKGVYLNGKDISENGWAYISSLGNYTLKIKATDYLGYTGEKEYAINLNNDFVSLVPEVRLVSLRAGETVKLPDFETYDYLNGTTPSKCIEVWAGSSLLTTLSSPFEYTVPEDKAELTLKYVSGKGSARETFYSETVKVLKKTFTNAYDGIIFDGTANAITDGVVFTLSATSKIKASKPLPADNFAMSFGYDIKDEENIESITLILTDAKDSSCTAKFVISNFSSGNAKFIVNEDGREFKVNFTSTAYKETAVGFKGERYYSLSVLFDNVLYKLSNEEGSYGGNVSTLLSGQSFTGFNSGLVFAELEVKVKDSKSAKIIVSGISNQKINSSITSSDFDTVGPNILFEKRISDGRYLVDTVVYIPGAKAYDYIQTSSSITLKITAPDGSTVYNGDCASGRELTLSQYGNYVITYTAKDSLNKRTLSTYYLMVYGDKIPEISVSGSVSSEYKVGDKLKVPNAGAVNKNGGATALDVSVVLRKPNGQYMRVVLGQEVELTQKGNYCLIYSAVDDFDNLSRSCYDFTVK